MIKIERPPHGDAARVLSPGGFKVLNSGKDCRLIDLRDSAGADAVLALATSADILVEGFRPGAMARLGLAYDRLRALNRRLVYVSITGFGQEGPRAQEPGRDIIYQAAAAYTGLTGGLAGEAADVYPISVSEFCAGQYALSSTLAAFLAVARGKRGQWLDVAIVDCLMHWWNARLGHFQHEGIAGEAAQREAVYAKPAYGIFRTRDDRSIALSAREDGFFRRLLSALDLRLDGMADRWIDRVANVVSINAAIAEAIRQHPADGILRLLRAADVPAAEVLLPDELAGSDHAVARDLFHQLDGMDYCRFPVRIVGR